MRPKHIVIIGSSAGGPRVLKDIFTGFPKINASIILVQHMPEFINISFTQSLNECTDMDVKLAEHGEHLAKGCMYVAPTGKHLKLLNNTQLQIVDGEKINFVCPAVDETLLSARFEYGVKFYAVILTGMGKDGAKGISYIKEIKGTTIAQDERTSIIYGMPREAFETGHVDYVLPSDMIAKKIIDSTGLLL